MGKYAETHVVQTNRMALETGLVPLPSLKMSTGKSLSLSQHQSDRTSDVACLLHDD